MCPIRTTSQSNPSTYSRGDTPVPSNGGRVNAQCNDTGWHTRNFPKLVVANKTYVRVRRTLRRRFSVDFSGTIRFPVCILGSARQLREKKISAKPQNRFRSIRVVWCPPGLSIHTVVVAINFKPEFFVLNTSTSLTLVSNQLPFAVIILMCNNIAF